MKRIQLLVLALIAAAAVPALPARAQHEHLNIDKLIKGLREQNMYELLVYLARSDQIKDPQDRKKLEIEMNILSSQRLINEPGSRDGAQAALEDGIKGFHDLIAANRDSTKRPLWQADLAMHLMYTRPGYYLFAADFYEYGVPTNEQRARFEDSAQRAIENLTDASLYLRSLESRLPREDDFNAAYVNTGRWEELMDEYYKTKIPFLLSLAAWNTTLLPDDHPYNKNLGANRFIPIQKTTPAAERQRLYTQVIDELNALDPSLKKKYGLPDRPLLLLRGKAMAALGQYDRAYPILDDAYNQGPGDILGLRAQLSKAVALSHQHSDPTRALDLLETVKDHKLVHGDTGDPLFRILVADLEHRIILRAAERDNKIEQAEMEAAYKPYDNLVNDKRLGQHVERVSVYVYKRWLDIFKDQGLDKLPPMVLVGMAHLEMMDGQNLVAEAFATGELSAPEKLEAARPHLEKCIELSQSLIDRGEQVPVEVRARAMFNKGQATFLIDPTAPPRMIEAARLLADIVPVAPEHPLAEEAIAKSLQYIAFLLKKLNLDAPEVNEAYEYVTAVLFEHLPDSATALDERTFYTFKIFQERAKYKEAAESYAKVPPSHADYLQAQREWLYCGFRLYRDLPEADRPAERDKLIEEGDRILGQARQAVTNAPTPETRQIAVETVASVMLIKVDLDMDRQAWDVAQRTLQNFLDDYDDKDLKTQALSKLVVVKVRQNRAEEAVQIAQQLMELAGDSDAEREAAANTIDNVLADIADEIDNLRTQAGVAVGDVRRKDLEARAEQLAQASLKLANMLLDWATGKNLPPDQLFRYRLIKVRALILTRQIDQADQALRPLIGQYSGDAQVLFLQAEVHFSRGDRASMIKAVPIYDQIINDPEMRPVPISPDLAPMERAQRIAKNRLWWLAWLRRLQISDILNAHTEMIPRLVKQLAHQYPDLGGPAIRPKLQALERKYGT